MDLLISILRYEKREEIVDRIQFRISFSYFLSLPEEEVSRDHSCGQKCQHKSIHRMIWAKLHLRPILWFRHQTQNQTMILVRNLELLF